jgi:hypothetical protein
MQNMRLNVKDLARQYQAEPERCMIQLSENLENGTYKPENFSFQDLFVAMHPEGRGAELLWEIGYGRGHGSTAALREAADYVSTGDFSNITGQIYFTTIKKAFNAPVLIWRRLARVVPTMFMNGERVPGIGPVSPGLVEPIGEGRPYPKLGLNENWTDTPPTVKHGFELGFSRESVVTDRTGEILNTGSKGAEALGVVIEKEVIDVATASNGKNPYNRNNVYTNTYLLAGAYVNDQTGNALDGQANEWRALEKADLLFDAMVSPDTNEPIGVPTNPQILVPSALLRTAERIIRATSVSTVDMRAQATTIRTEGENPLGSRRPEILSNQYVKARTGSTSQWFYGDFMAALEWRQMWDIESLDAVDNNEAKFERDIWSRKRFGYRGVAMMMEPRFLTRNNT